MDEKQRKEISKNIGNRIYNLRKSHNLSREKFAEICDISSQHVYYMEKGYFLPGCVTIIDICNNFSITPSQLLIDTLKPDDNLFNESIYDDFSKLSDEDKKFLQKLVSSTIQILLNKIE